MYCTHCKKTVVSYSVSFGALTDEQLEETRKYFEQKGELVVFNPPPRKPLRCPQCGGECSDDAGPISVRRVN